MNKYSIMNTLGGILCKLLILHLTRARLMSEVVISRGSSHPKYEMT